MYLCVKKNLVNFFAERQNSVFSAGRMNFLPEIDKESSERRELTNNGRRIGRLCRRILLI